MIGNLIVSIWKLQWLTKFSSQSQKSYSLVNITLINDLQPKKTIQKSFSVQHKQTIIKQNVMLSLKDTNKQSKDTLSNPNKQKTFTKNIDVKVQLFDNQKKLKQQCSCIIQVHKYWDKMGLTPLKLMLEASINNKVVKVCRLYCDIQIIKNSQLKFQKQELKPDQFIYYNFQRFKLEIEDQNINQKVSMFDLIIKSQQSNDDKNNSKFPINQQVIVRTNQITYKKLTLQTTMANPLKKIVFRLKSKKIGTSILLGCTLENANLVVSYFQLPLKNIETDEKVGFLSFNLFFTNTLYQSQPQKLKGVLKLYSVLIHINDKQFSGKNKFKIIYGKQHKFGFINLKIEDEQTAWMQSCVFKRQQLQNELRFEMCQVTNNTQAYAALFTNQFLDGTRYCNKMINLYSQKKKIGEIKIDFEFEQEKKLSLPDISNGISSGGVNR